MTDDKDETEVEQASFLGLVKMFVVMMVGAVVLVALVLFISSGIRSEAETEAEKAANEIIVQKALASNPKPADLMGGLSQEIVYVVDARDRADWVHVRFSQISFVRAKRLIRDSSDWDIAIRRAKIVSNGGITGPGKVSVAAIPQVSFPDVRSAPTKGYVVDEPSENPTEPMNPALDKWYKYDFWNHKLTTLGLTYVIRTADGGVAKFVIADYYCGKSAACYTLHYVYQGNGSDSFVQ